MMSRPHSKFSERGGLFGLHDLSIDITHHQDDEYFCDNGGTIHYVFDENIFEFFVFPSRRTRYVDHSGGNAQVANEVSESLAQTAMLTAETLFGGQLPGQRQGLIYLTDWHRWELLARMNEVLREVGSPKRLKKAMKKAQAVLRAKMQIWEDSAEIDWSNLEKAADPFLSEDLQALRDEDRIDEAALLSFARNREAALLLATDEFLEPSQQLSRMLDRPMQEKLKGLITLRRPNAVAMAELEDNARYWWRVIRREVEAQAARAHARAIRSRTSLWNDAQSLALVEWAATHVDARSERVVLVTGDATLHDAYRRQYERDGRDRKFINRPYVLRRPIQYSPVFLSEYASTVAGGAILGRVQQAVELMLAPLRLAAIAKRDDLRRSHYALTLPEIGKGHLRGIRLERLVPRRGDFRRARLREITTELDFTERVLVGLSRDLIAQRINADEEKLFSRVVHALSADQEEAFRDYIQQTIAKLFSSAVQVWKPIAEHYLDDLNLSDGASRRRVPIALRFDEAGEGDTKDLIAFLRFLQQPRIGGRSSNIRAADYLESSFDFFVAAGTAALIANDWRTAEHFCDIAINAFQILAEAESIPAASAAEVYYLSGLTKRFRLGEINVSAQRDAYDAAVRIRSEAHEALAESQRRSLQHATLGATAVAFISCRANSERAALDLFFAEFASAQAEQVQGGLDMGEEAKRAHEAAGAALSECTRIFKEVPAGRIAPKVDGDPIELLRLQHLTNIAAWFSIGGLIHGESFSKMRPELYSDCLEDFDALMAFARFSTSALFIADLLAFKVVNGIDLPHSESELSQLGNQFDRTTLELASDRRLFDRLVALGDQNASD